MTAFLRPTALAAVGLAASLALSGCGKSPADAAFDNKVHAYLLEHPEVIREAMAALEAKELAEQNKQAIRALGDPEIRRQLERDPRDFVANPNGRVTVTEFYDYRCGHCINAAPKVLALIEQHPEIRFVFKEFVIFGPDSLYAARAALAARKAGGDYVGVYHDFMAADALDPEIVDAILKARGVDPKIMLDPAFQKAADAQLLDVRALAKKVGASGTPHFIVGDQIVEGEDMTRLAAAIEKALKAS
ncbi:protein-disulfide isomerase [Caulobacter ginsengisoli]|uniref:Protein-disulfide isomerase n=1 Tax=Caulobacter ginsengisoli TaxID=400775 RepID=A0ABU0IN73_9CAUL|nr:thioredoxin domain-containing protein [Caulobacter ginsengisoli]MDQ0462870.1 protein-disulfide isomerase [Caulobacter ginsengisoli]